MILAGTLPILSVAALVSGAAAILASYRPGGRTAFYVLKPLTTLLIVAIVAESDRGLANQYPRLVALGLVFALAGDVLLMLPERYFPYGIASFAVTHLLYLAAFSTQSGLALLHPLTGVFALAAALIGRLVWGGVPSKLRLPVVVYIVLITSMVSQAAGAALAGTNRSATVAAAGALLFFASDALLAIDRFRARFLAARALVLGAYWLGQWTIALSAVGA